MAAKRILLGGQLLAVDDQTGQLIVTSSGAKQLGLGVIAVGNTSAGNAVACAVDQPCLYAIIEPPSTLDGGANSGEIKVAVVQAGELIHAQCLAQGRSLNQANFEGIVVACTSTNQLRFASTTNGTKAKVFAVVSA